MTLEYRQQLSQDNLQTDDNLPAVTIFNFVENYKNIKSQEEQIKNNLNLSIFGLNGELTEEEKEKIKNSSIKQLIYLTCVFAKSAANIINSGIGTDTTAEATKRNEAMTARIISLLQTYNENLNLLKISPNQNNGVYHI